MYYLTRDLRFNFESRTTFPPYDDNYYLRYLPCLAQLPAYADCTGSLPPTLSVPSLWDPSPGISLGFGIPPHSSAPRPTESARLENLYDKQTARASLLHAGESESAHSLPACTGES